MNRKELYACVKQLELEDEIRKTTNLHYTNVSSQILNDIICKFKKSKTKEKKSCKGADKLSKLIEILTKKHVLLKSELVYIND